MNSKTEQRKTVKLLENLKVWVYNALLSRGHYNYTLTVAGIEDGQYISEWTTDDFQKKLCIIIPDLNNLERMIPIRYEICKDQSF